MITNCYHLKNNYSIVELLWNKRGKFLNSSKSLEVLCIKQHVKIPVMEVNWVEKIDRDQK